MFLSIYVVGIDILYKENFLKFFSKIELAKFLGCFCWGVLGICLNL